ncbi:MAG: hypothetical protein KF749_14945 [Bacteroidetes bacterium]|nr:hypothetical protein [Bacteroidota bacterium]MCW5896016.1 hypothetical protein [Bacteroidota bacterium]
MNRENHIKDFIDKARTAIASGEYESALNEISSVLLIDSSHAEALSLATHLGELLEDKRLGTIGHAEPRFNETGDVPPLSRTVYDLHLAKAQQFCGQQLYDKAMAEITQALLANPFAEEAQELEQQLQQKVSAQRTVSPLHTSASVNAVLLVAKRYFERKRFAEALEEVETGLAIEGNHPELLWLRGAILEQIDLQGTLHRDHRLRDFLSRIRERFAKTEFDKALEDIQAALKEFPEDRELIALREEITSAYNSWQELQLFECHTTAVSEHIRNGRQLLRFDRVAEAASEIALGLLLAPYNEELKNLEKEMWDAQSRLEQARIREEDERTSVQKSVTVQMHVIAAEEFAKLGQFNRALDELAQAYLIDPVSAEARNMESKVRQAQQRAAASPLKLVYKNNRAARA